jgi:hypothetical protein
VLLAQALAALVSNRAAAGADHRRATGRPHPEFGNGTLDAAARGVARHLVDAPPALLRHAPGASRAADPTSGALFVHPHWESPLWAAGLRATALIGPYLFLTFPEHSTEKEFCHAR